MIPQSGISVNTPDRILVDAGAIYLNYGLPNERLLGATRGGNEFNLNRVTRNIEIDGLKGAVKGLKRITEVNPQITANLIELTVENIILAIAGANTTATPTTDVLAEYLGVGTVNIDDFTCGHFPIVPLSDKVYVDGVLVVRGLEGDSLFIGDNAVDNKGFGATIGDWEAGTGGVFASVAGGVSGYGGKYTVGASPSTDLPSLDDDDGLVLTNLVVGKTYKFIISIKKDGADSWDGGVVTVNIDGQAFALDALTTSYVQTVISFTATGTEATITLTCASTPSQADIIWIDSLEFTEYEGDYTINNTTGVVQFILEDVPDDGEEVTIAYAYETGGTPTHDTITGGEIEDSDYIDNVALVGNISGKGTPIICIIKNALADAGFALATAPRDESVPKVVFTGHYSGVTADEEPWEIRYPRV
jgi:hypothetical protein